MVGAACGPGGGAAMVEATLIFLGILGLFAGLGLIVGSAISVAFDAGFFDASGAFLFVAVAAFALGVLAGWWFL